MRNEQRERILNQKREEQAFDKECTFKPKISGKSKKIATEKSASTNVDFFKKNQIWYKEKHDILEKLRSNKADIEYDECTFKPDIVSTFHPKNY